MDQGEAQRCCTQIITSLIFDMRWQRLDGLLGVGRVKAPRWGVVRCTGWTASPDPRREPLLLRLVVLEFYFRVLDPLLLCSLASSQELAGRYITQLQF